jgi:hypothetical protein
MEVSVDSSGARARVELHERDREPTVKIRTGLGASQRPITVLQVVGEHDFGSRFILMKALEDVHGHVVVDLSSCQLLDASVIGAIFRKERVLADGGYRLELVMPPTAPFSRVIERLRVEIADPRRPRIT